jgi:glycosyltransferase involved in cell wall biosynthesis
MPDETPEQQPQPEQKPEQKPQRPQRPRFQPRRQNFRRPQPQGETPQGEESTSATPAEGTQPPQPQPQRPQSRPPQIHRQQSHGIDITVLIPLYNEDESLKELHQQLRSTLGRMNVRYELLFVDDGSTDRSFQVLRDLKRLDNRISIIRFRRNFGKSAALAVGFEKAQGRIVITMDADLQDDPSEIPGLVKKINEGYDLVSGWKRVRRDPLSKTIPSKFFNFVTRIMTGVKIHDFNCGLKAYRNEVVKSVRVYGELHRYIPALAQWEGFIVGEMPVNHRARKFGKTKFGLGRFWKGFLDLLTMLFTTRYFRRPLHLFGFWGIAAAVAGIIIDGWLVIEWFTGATALSNRPLFLGGILLIIVGIQFVSIGLLGEMISKTRQTTEEYAIRDYIK